MMKSNACLGLWPRQASLITALLAVACFVHASWCGAAELPARVDFNYHVRPILSDRCFTCHGPDADSREADLRLDTREGAFAALDAGEGSHVIRPGDPDQSDVYLRLVTDDEDMRMPPVDADVTISADEIAIIKRWIEQGAEWKDHWSFIPLENTPVPDVKNAAWARSPIDRFVLAELERQGMSPSADADREQLIRRVTFDITGLPPTSAEIDAFLADESANAYERLVDRLLRSPRYGERMAVDWLDVARYADTYGYQSDVYRAMWPWRDWVIRAFNDNMPYDQFITWQIAGDLLPDATSDQILATAFNRHHRQTNEGGSIEAEFHVEYVADRTHTFGTAFLGLALECARCHDHKYDPVTQREYYQLFSFFNNIDESGLYAHFTGSIPTPTLLLGKDAEHQKIADFQRQISEAEARLEAIASSRQDRFKAWREKKPAELAISGLIGDYPFDELKDGKLVNRIDEKTPGSVSEGPQIVIGKVGNGLKLSGENNMTTKVGGGFTRDDPFSIALWIQTPDHKERAVVFHRSKSWTDAGSRGYQLLLEDGRLSASLIHFWPGNAIRVRTKEPVITSEWVHVTVTYDGSSRAAGLRVFVDGKLADTDVVRDNLYKNITGGGASSFTIGQRFRDKGFKNGLVDELKIFDRSLVPIEVAQVYDGKSLQGEATNGDGLYAFYLNNHDEAYREQLATLAKLRKSRSSVINPIAEIMVMRELAAPRPTFVLQRGSYELPGEEVKAQTPKCLPAIPGEGSRNRLDLARWLTDPGHPLTSRVTANRLWQAFFGEGLVATPNDFGAQGELPTHPELLDWLSKTLIDSDWDVKRLVKQIVMSSTYRQTSIALGDQMKSDPQNRFLARGPSYRLPAEMIRDGALAASGLLIEKQGGPSVKPYQPAGLWKEKSAGTYNRDKGEGSHRRSLYTYWKRTSPPPAMMTLDAAKRDVCIVKRQTTATPLQALVLLNDPQYVEAARALAAKAMTAGGDELGDRLAYIFRTLTSRRPNERQLEILRQLHDEQLALFELSPMAAADFLAVGDFKPSPDIKPVELAAMTVVAKALLNYDETVTKR